MDEEKIPAEQNSEPETARETGEGGRKKHALLTACLLLALALVLLLAAALLFTVRIGGKLYLTADTIDLRERDVSVEEYEQAAARRPDVPIRWSVPLGGAKYDNFAETITLDSLAEDEIGLLADFPYLETVDAGNCRDYEALAAAAKAYPELRFLWSIPSSDGPVDGNTRTLTARRMTAGEMEKLLGLLPFLERADLRESERPDAEIDAFMAAHPELPCDFTVRVWGQELPGDSESLRFAGGAAGSYEELLEALRRFPKLKRLDLRDSDALPSQLAELLPACEDVEMEYVIRLYGKIFTADMEQIDLSGVEIEDTSELEAAVKLMKNLKKVVMCDCGVPNEEMAALNERCAPVRFVWTVYFSVYALRTDTTYFCASDLPDYNYLAPELTDAQIAPIKYCTDLVALDLGHMHFTDLSFLYNMPHLKYLILVEGWFHDITPIGSLEELEYLEIFKNKINDISPLLNCKKLKHLNMCYTYGFDPEPLREMKSLERLWYVGMMLKEPLRSQLPGELPNCYCYFPYDDPQGSTGGGWRENEAYYEMRDVFGMYYQPGGTGIHHEG